MLLDLATAVAAVNALIAKHPLLPAGRLAVDPDSDQTLTVHLHGGFGDFEAWREALGIDTASVSFASTDLNTTMRAETPFGGARLHLVGYSGRIQQAAAKAVA